MFRFGWHGILQNEALRRKDMEISKLRKDLENANAAFETAESTLRRKHNTMISEISNEVENLQKQKGKYVQTRPLSLFGQYLPSSVQN